jgi:hypothetical protein
MREEWEIWNDVLIHLGFQFREEITMIGSKSNSLIYEKKSYKTHEYKRQSKLYVDRNTGKVVYFSVTDYRYGFYIINKEEFEKENKDIFREFKLKYLFD